ncbi:uncharacterized protein LOC106866520 [Brachypodium distachyon]|uniref:Uncharacterized protein n=1 Tax=Brachypodium distachyon TaxID=15368 RepID=A0A0Q3FG64_BRADI|nr:uncharacterized protein LOC106866520 [Brachypodium distachyon]KQJ98615.1 hypothetical protein BRADI_3g38033v3 [Brachypodium distachyon]|eukprot:XP_024316988.1 uncharacterized protein LOC106866520 [Brachypodium distachyon]
MAGSKALCICILIFIVISSQQAEARRLTKVAATSKSELGALKDDGQSFKARAGQDGKAMPMATTVDSRSTSPGNSPGIGNKGKTTNN